MSKVDHSFHRDFPYGLSLEPIQTRSLRDYNTTTSPNLKEVEFLPGATYRFGDARVAEGSRCVVLRPKLEVASESFANYVIAHEFAHAFLRNGGWGEITDVEEAADALAASWGFHKPAT